MHEVGVGNWWVVSLGDSHLFSQRRLHQSSVAVKLRREKMQRALSISAGKKLEGNDIHIIEFYTNTIKCDCNRCF